MAVEPIHVDRARQDTQQAELDAAIEKQKTRAAKLRARLNKPVDATVTIGLAIAERFIDRLDRDRSGEALQSIAWSKLQIEEVAQVLDETERLIGKPPPGGRVFVTEDLPAKPIFAGYGHFDQVAKDLLNFRSLGATLIQDGRCGP